MAVFISYSSQDRSSLDALTTALRLAQQRVWFDQELGGGDSWWNKILEEIRSCEVFIVALSNNWLRSKPCQAELRYARTLQRPILPVRVGPVDNVRVNPVAALQIVDYQNPTVDSGIQLISAVHGLQAQAPPLPSPLPEGPPVPFGYLMRLGNILTEKELSPQQQIQLLVELKSGLAEDGDDPSARSDIAQLLRMLRVRHDVTYRTRSEIDAVLSSIEPKTPPVAASTQRQGAGRAAQSASTAARSSPPGTGGESTTPTRSGTAATVAGPKPSPTPSTLPAAREGGASQERSLTLGGGDRSAAADTKRSGRRRVYVAAALVGAVVLVAGGAALAVRFAENPPGAPSSPATTAPTRQLPPSPEAESTAPVSPAPGPPTSGSAPSYGASAPVQTPAPVRTSAPNRTVAPSPAPAASPAQTASPTQTPSPTSTANPAPRAGTDFSGTCEGMETCPTTNQGTMAETDVSGTCEGSGTCPATNQGTMAETDFSGTCEGLDACAAATSAEQPTDGDGGR